MFCTTVATLRGVAVFVLKDEAQEHDGVVSQDMALFLWAERATGAVKGSRKPAAVVETLPTQRDTWPHRAHGCSPATDCRCEQRHRHVQSHMCAWALVCQLQTQALHTRMSPCLRLECPDVPARHGGAHRATSMALSTHSKTWAHVYSPSPSLVPDIERKKFRLPQTSPCAVPFFFFSLLSFS